MSAGRSEVAEVLLYRLESVSDGSPISCGSSSIRDSPVLLVRVLYIVGSSMKDLTLKIDHVLSAGNGLSRNISVLVDRRAGHSVIK